MKKKKKPYTDSQQQATNSYAATKSALATDSASARGEDTVGNSTDANDGKNAVSADQPQSTNPVTGPQSNPASAPASSSEPDKASDGNAENDYPTHEYENFVFEGGGVRGLAYVGAIKAFEQYYGPDGLKPIKRVGGASAGAITAMLIALGYRGEELLTIARDIDFLSFLFSNEKISAIIDSIGTTVNTLLAGRLNMTLATKLLNESAVVTTGVFSKSDVMIWLSTAFTQMSLSPNLTFAELHDLTLQSHLHKDLYITVSNLSMNESIVFSYEDTPNASILQAVSYSMSFPFVFEAGSVQINGSGTSRTFTDVEPSHPSAQLLADGGIFDNYPLTLFDESETRTNSRTLGFRLDSSEEIQRYYYGGHSKPVHIQGMHGLLGAFLFDVPFKAQIEGFIRRNDAVRSVFIDTRDTGAMDFNMDESAKRNLLVAGWYGFANFTPTGMTPPDDFTEDEAAMFSNQSRPREEEQDVAEPGGPAQPGDDNDADEVNVDRDAATNTAPQL